jgi:hypothetical protein
MFHTMSERTHFLTHSDRILGTFPDSTPSSSDQSCKMKMHMEHYTGNNSYRERPEYVEINMPNEHIVRHKSQMIWPGVETEPPGWEVND